MSKMLTPFEKTTISTICHKVISPATNGFSANYKYSIKSKTLSWKLVFNAIRLFSLWPLPESQAMVLVAPIQGWANTIHNAFEWASSRPPLPSLFQQLAQPQDYKLINPIKGTVTQKVVFLFMIKDGVYSAVNLKFYMFNRPGVAGAVL